MVERITEIEHAINTGYKYSCRMRDIMRCRTVEEELTQTEEDLQKELETLEEKEVELETELAQHDSIEYVCESNPIGIVICKQQENVININTGSMVQYFFTLLLFSQTCFLLMFLSEI